MYPLSRIYGYMPAAPAILDDLTALADLTRGRLLLMVESQELTVSELCSILQLPQSTVSRHLKALADSGWVTSRAEGTSRLYAMAREGRQGAPRRLWLLVREQLSQSRAAEQDHRRLQSVLAARRSQSQEFFSSAAGQWDRLREELFGRDFHLHAAAGLLDPDWVVGDLGCGTGSMTFALAPFVSRVIAIDNSAAMLSAAKRRLAAFDNVELRRGDLEAVPLTDGALDAATLTLVLPYLPTPLNALREVARVMKPGGRMLMTDLLPHDREHFRQQLGHLWLGFGEAQVSTWLRDAGFDRIRVGPLPAAAEAKGPGLFVATGVRRSSVVS
jgi:ubiquinone/menaquinone biosynthesis C-methylase UbiE